MSVTLADYRAAVRTPGAALPVAGSALGRLPIAMYGLAVLLYVQRTTGSFASAGLVSAGILIGMSVGAVAQGRIMDRRGPAVLLLVVAGLFATTSALLLVLIATDRPVAVLVAAAALSGATMPALPGASRSLWTALLPPGPRREAGYGYEAISLEVFFILGPAVAAFLVTAPWPGTGAVVAVAAMVVGTVVFACSPVVRAVRGSIRTGRRSLLGVLARPGLRIVALASLGFGVVIGSVEVGVPAVTAAAGSAALGGVLLSAWSVTSVLGGIGYAARPWPRSLHQRLPVLLVGFALVVGGMAAAAATGSVLATVLVMLLAGALITPQTTAHSVAIDVVVDERSGTEAFGWVVTAATVGIAAGQSLAGVVVEAVGPHAAFLVGGAGGLLLAAVVWLGKAAVRAEPGGVSERLADSPAAP
ncbi:MFS transporter [Pseudonocardia sulfidoxydans NBRC 16205]|uniref:MFS transporter n=1 Tax=Pseudonocardia sulfidoxydans NBRC 16205 TaxID=1223511 RepID=A0A511DEZ0_9PSEU|nr:MFS transporter [Pseudonocardia sulfidoxydans]GEL23359.1 MFS transporter [Pseudonocardia sulfidoxydans NBRC 16205]